MQATATQAMIPKARGMFSKRISPAEYEELMRRRTVPELAVILKRHPYFGGSLATLSTTEPHRGQIEELLSMDIFQKYSALAHYDFGAAEFTGYYLAECEMREVLKALHLLSIGLAGAYLNQVPAYLVGKTEVDLFALGQARSFAQAVEATAHTSLYRPLRARLLADPALRAFPLTEAALLRSHYANLFELINACLKGPDAEATTTLFRQEAEVYNLEILLRIKAYFPAVYTPADIERLMLPYRYKMKRGRLAQMVNAPNLESLLAILRASNSARQYFGSAALTTPDELAAAGGRKLYTLARRTLHLTASPVAALAALVTLAKLERENIVNVVEGVRYGLEPETIRTMLRN